MIINCKSCDTSYDIKEDLVAANGSKVRCSNCEEVFMVYPSATAGNRAEKSSDASEISGHEETTVFENKIEGIIDGFDTEQSFEALEISKTKEIGLQYLEKTSIIDFQEIENPDGAAHGHDEGEVFGSEKENTGFSNEAVSFEETDFGLETMPEAELDIDGDFGDFDLDLEETNKQEVESQWKTGSEPIASSDAEADMLEDFELDLDDEYDTDGREYEVDLIEEHEPIEDIGTEEFGFDLGEDEPFNAEAGAKDEFAANDFAVELDFEAEADEAEETGAMNSSEDTFSDVDYHQATLDFDFDLDGIEDADAASPTSAAEDDDFELDFDLDLDFDGEEKNRVADSTATVISDEDGFDLTDVEEFLDLEQELGQQHGHGNKQSFSLGLGTKSADVSGKAGNDEDYDFELATQKNETTSDGDNLNNISMVTALDPQGNPDFGNESNAEENKYEEIVPVGDETLNTGVIIGQKRTRPVLKIALLVSVFIAIAGGGYFYMLETQSPVPPEATRIAAPTPPPVQEGLLDSNGNLQISISRPGYSFITNENTGEIMVIRGSVTNHYDHSRKDIQVKGNVYDRSGELLFSSAPVYAGAMVDADDLLTREPAEIEKGLSSGSVNTLIDYNQSVPFMIVFSQLPAELGELSVEVVASRAVNE